MISPPVPATSPAGADLHRTSSRRRGLSYFRAFSHSRSGNTSPNEPSRSPRHYFQRSLSHNSDSRSHRSVLTTRHRSNSRPDEPTSPLGDRGGVSASSLENLHSPTSPATSRLGPNSSLAQPAHNTTSTDTGEDSMARQRTSTLRRHTTAGHLQTSSSTTEAVEQAARPANPRTQSGRTPGTNTESESKPQLPAIRLHSHQEARNGRPSLTFSPISRTLPSESSIIRVGRYSEREGVPNANPSAPSDAPVGFKSKVVSRKHCEFSFVDGQWQIKDVASSSGTFLNHIRLSQPNTESRLFPIKDGDIVQLGIDFRGGEEMIFRCVKIRVECNRSWQKKPNTFNKSRHQQLQSLAKDEPSADANSSECCICLGSVLPCQALFVAPCAHVWHYKCIRPMLEGRNSTYPQFQCPNCRAYSDLAADVDVAQSDIDEWMDGNEDDSDRLAAVNASNNVDTTETEDASADGQATEPPEAALPATATSIDALRTSLSNGLTQNPNSPPAVANELSNSPTSMRGSGLLARRQATNPVSPEVQAMNGNIDLPERLEPDDSHVQLDQQRTRTQTPDIDHTPAGEGPLTPRNNAGPFVFDGSAGRTEARHPVVPGIPEVVNASQASAS
ncbi:hypothetical protein PV10_04535 [Exophiala mesophila]|uniref:FHA domain-containing protein n=1 Tax=Exophiala mesophila TaxID=212818 RepID=A0A0D1ZEY1_EXOME|nr:uncharacterized protein PV10_04535 [Exophiala mesophila]KIV93312.1 hypothetical protein PV10_04535 [Exophiala mesophila]